MAYPCCCEQVCECPGGGVVTATTARVQAEWTLFNGDVGLPGCGGGPTCATVAFDFDITLDPDQPCCVYAGQQAVTFDNQGQCTNGVSCSFPTVVGDSLTMRVVYNPCVDPPYLEVTFPAASFQGPPCSDFGFNSCRGLPDNSAAGGSPVTSHSCGGGAFAAGFDLAYTDTGSGLKVINGSGTITSL